MRYTIYIYIDIVVAAAAIKKIYNDTSSNFICSSAYNSDVNAYCLWQTFEMVL